MSTPEHDDSTPAGLISLHDMVRRAADHQHGPGEHGRFRGTTEVTNTLDRPGGGIKVTFVPPSAAQLLSLKRREEAEELIRAAADAGDLLIHFEDGQRPPPGYWRSDSGREAIRRGYFVARYTGMPKYEGEPLYAGEVNFAHWLAGGPKHSPTAAERGPAAAMSKGRPRLQRDAAARALVAIFDERSKWPRASKRVLGRVNKWLEADGSGTVSLDTLRRAIRGE